MEHWFDCAIYDEDAKAGKECDCGGVNMRSRMKAFFYWYIYEAFELSGLLNLNVFRRRVRLSTKHNSVCGKEGS